MEFEKTQVSFHLKLNILSLIKDDICNYRKLNQTQVQYIKTSTTDDEKIEIIELFNRCLYIVCKILINDEFEKEEMVGPPPNLITPFNI